MHIFKVNASIKVTLLVAELILCCNKTVADNKNKDR